MRTIAEGIEQDWLHDDKVIVYKVANLTDSSLSQWSQSVVHTLTNWDSDLFLALYDLSEPGVSLPFLMRLNYQIKPGLTTRGQEYVDRILQERSDLRVYVAVILPPTGSGNVTAARSQIYNTPAVTMSLFFKYEKGLEWLEEQLSQPTA